MGYFAGKLLRICNDDYLSGYVENAEGDVRIIHKNVILPDGSFAGYDAKLPRSLEVGEGVRASAIADARLDFLPEVRLELTSLSAVDFESAAFTISPLRQCADSIPFRTLRQFATLCAANSGLNETENRDDT